MKKIIHLCCSGTKGAFGYAMKNGFLEGHKVVCLVDDLSNGFIDDNNSISKRIDWYKNILAKDNYYEIEHIEESYLEISNCIDNIQDEDVYIWYGRNGREICGLLYILSLLKKVGTNIYIIDVSEITFNLNKENQFSYRSVGDIIPEKLNDLISTKKIVDLKKYFEFMNIWENLKLQNSILRIFDGKEILSVSEDYFDNFILKYTSNRFRKCAMTVGSVLGFNETPVTEYYIFWRVIELIKKNRIVYKGNLGIMIEMEIKKNICFITSKKYNCC